MHRIFRGSPPFLLAVLFVCVTAGADMAQTLSPSSPNVVAPPKWSRTLHMPDGRTFVTDGGLAIDAAVAKPSSLPPVALPPASAATLAALFTTPYDHEIGLDELRSAERPNTLAAPSGVALNGNYVSFLQKSLPAGKVRLRLKGAADPIVVLADGKVIGVLMPVKQ